MSSRRGEKLRLRGVNVAPQRVESEPLSPNVELQRLEVQLRRLDLEAQISFFIPPGGCFGEPSAGESVEFIRENSQSTPEAGIYV